VLRDGRSRVAGAALAAFAAGLIALPGQAAGPSATPYLTPIRAQFSLNDKWHGTHPVPSIPLITQTAVTAPGDPGAAVWATTCGAAQQNVSFTRTLQLLGPPRDGTFFWYFGANPSNGWYGLKSLDLSVNGAHVYHWGGGSTNASFTFPATAFKHFKVGANTFELKATRAPLPAGSKICNLRGGKLSLGLEGLFTFDFATDLRPGVPATPVTIYHGTSAVIKEFLLNQGPDRALDGYLLVFYGAQGSVRLVITSGEARQCDHVGNTEWYCRFDSLDPGEKLEIIMGVTFTPNPGLPNWDHEQESVQFKAFSETPDTNSSNDDSQVGFIFCQAGSTLPDCK
jgi:hypothetical protein